MSARYFFKSSLSALAFMLTVGVSQAQPANPPEMGKMMERHISRMADSIGASADQKAKLLAIAKATQADLKPLHEQAKAGREQGMVLFSAVTLDAAAIEQHRVAQSQIREAISRRMTQSMLDSAMVLTPEQRVKMTATMRARHGRHPMHDMPKKN